MHPHIDSTSFGSITVDGWTCDHDIMIRLDGSVKKRKKKLSRDVYGTSHTVALEEAQLIYQEGAELLIIGNGQSGGLALSDQAASYLIKKGCACHLFPTPVAIDQWNRARGKVIGLFHVTC